MCGWILLSILLLLALLVQMIRITDMKGDIFRKKSRIELIERDEKNLADQLEVMTVSRDGYAAMYHDACDEITALNQQVSRLQKDLDEETAECSMIISRKDTTIQELRDHITTLRKNRAIVSAGHLQSGLTYLMRFVAANQWMMENDKSLAEAVASVSEVAEAITERER